MKQIFRYLKFFPALPLLLGMGLSGVTFLTWQSLREAVQWVLNQTLNTQLQILSGQIQSQLNLHIHSLEQMERRWNRSPQRNQSEWSADAQGYVDFPGYQAIQWVDSTYVVRWIVPLASNEQALNYQNQLEKWLITLADARRSRKTTISESINLVQGGKGFLVFIPVFPQGQFDGFITDVFHVEQFIDGALPPIGHDEGHKHLKFGMRIWENGEIIYDCVLPTWPQNRKQRLTLSSQKALPEINTPAPTWEIEIAPSPHLGIRI